MKKLKAGIWDSQMRLPPQEKCIYLDIETDIDTNKVWLIGVKNQNSVSQFLAKNYSYERDILIQFGEYLHQHPLKPLICYSTTNFDFRVIWKRLNNYGLDKTKIAMKNRAWIDLGTLLRRHFTPFGRSYSLKIIRYLIGYSYENEALRGDEMAIRYYKQIRKHNQITDNFRREALSYNKDDINILDFMVDKFKDKIIFSQKYIDNLTIDRLQNLIYEKSYSSTINDRYVRISVLHKNVEVIQTALMSFGLPLPQKKIGVNVTALYWKSKLAYERIHQLISENGINFPDERS